MQVFLQAWEIYCYCATLRGQYIITHWSYLITLKASNFWKHFSQLSNSPKQSTVWWWISSTNASHLRRNVDNKCLAKIIFVSPSSRAFLHFISYHWDSRRTLSTTGRDAYATFLDFSTAMRLHENGAEYWKRLDESNTGHTMLTTARWMLDSLNQAVMDLRAIYDSLDLFNIKY